MVMIKFKKKLNNEKEISIVSNEAGENPAKM